MRSKRTLKKSAGTGTSPSTGTRQRLVSAALRTLTQRGFAGATARTIADQAKTNQALIFYHFGSVDRLLLAALDATSESRLARYRTGLAGVGSVGELVDRMARLYKEDAVSGHITAVQEMVAGSSSVPALRKEVLTRMTPWIAFAREVAQRLLTGTLAEKVVSLDDLAYAAVAFYFGLETITHLAGDRDRVQALFTMGRRLAPIADALLQSATWVGESA